MELTRKLEISLKKEIFKKSYYEFFKEAFEVLHPGEDYNDNWHAEYLCGVLQEEAYRIRRKQPRDKDIIINMPFRAAKSMITTIIFPVWCWTLFPEMKFITVSYSESLALEHAQRSRDLILSEWFEDLYGSRIKLDDTQAAKGFYRNTFGGSRKSVGTGGTITGSGSDIIICDDPQNPKKAASEVERENTINFYNHTLFSRLNQLDIGVRIVVQQRLHQKDLTGALTSEKPEKYNWIRIPAEITEKHIPLPVTLEKNYVNGLFWHTRFSKKVLSELRYSLGSLQAAGQLQQAPAPEEGNLFKKEWFRIIEPESIVRDYVNDPVMFYIDTADTEKTQNDPYAILAAFKKDKVVYIVDVKEKHFAFPNAIKYIVKYVEANYYTQNSKIKVEPKTAGKSIVSQLRAVSMLNVVELKPPKDDKVTRASAILPTCESGRVVFIRGGYVDKFLEQLTTFPNSAHDDMTDVFVYCVTDLLLDGDFDFAFL